MSDISSWLSSLGLDRYIAVFVDNDIDFDVLSDLTEHDLERLGVSLGHRKKLLKALAAAETPNERHENNSVAPSAEQFNPRDSSPRSYTPKHLADKILQSRAALEGERKQVTVLFADIQGSMQLAGQLDPEAWHQVLDRYFSILTDAVHRFEGTVNQYTGDGIMALFGAPIAHEDHAQRACYAALQARAALARYADELRLTLGVSCGTRIGLNSGEVIVGRIGDNLRMDYTAQGATVGTAQRIEQIAGAGTIFLSHTTQRLVEGYFRLRNVGNTQLAGISDPIRVYELEDVGVSRTRIDVATARGLSRFVGRHDEMQGLEAALGRAANGHGQVVGVVGDPGQGKSRLCLEFVQQCRARGIQVIEGRCPAHGRNIPYLPILEIYRAYFGITLADTPELARQKIAGSLVLLDTALTARLPDLFEFMGVGDPRNPAPSIDGELRQRQLFDIMHRAYQAHHAQRKLVVTLIDDLHWVDPGSNAFVEQMVTATANSHSLLLLNFRPEYSASFARKSHYQQLPLVPLGAAAARELIASLIGTEPALSALADRVVEWTAGNPFFTEEIVQSLLETGHLVGRPGAYRLVTELGRLQVPVNVQGVLAGRIDRLPDNAKRLLQSAAVVGLHFSEPVLREMGELGDHEFEAALDALRDGDFVHETILFPAREFAFKHPLTQEVAYRSLLQPRRITLHAAVARALEAQAGSKLDELAALLAHHWDEAVEPSQAIHWFVRAATRANRVDHPAARRYWARVRQLAELLPPIPEYQAIGAHACANSILLGFRTEGAREVTQALFDTGVHLAEAASAPHSLALLHAAYGFAIGVTYGDMNHALKHTGIAVEKAQQVGESELIGIAHVFRMDMLMWAGRIRDALKVAQQTQAQFEGDFQHGRQLIGNSSYLNAVNHVGFAHLFMGDTTEAHRLLAQVAALSQQSGEIETGLWVTLWESYLSNLQGDHRACDLLAVRCAELGRQFDSGIAQVVVQICTGFSHVMGQRWFEAVEIFSEAHAVGHQKFCARTLSPLVFCGLSFVHLKLGNLVQALRYAKEIAQFCTDVGLIYSAQPWLVLARCHIARKDLAAAFDAIEKARSVINETGAIIYLGELHEIRADFALQCNQHWQRAEQLDIARAHYIAINATAHVARLDNFGNSGPGS